MSSTFAAEVRAVGHRIVHGLDISQPALLDEGVVAKIREAAVLAPLHNPPGLQVGHDVQLLLLDYYYVQLRLLYNYYCWL